MSKGWSHEELEAAVRAYFSMLDAQKTGKKIVKKDHYRTLAEHFNRSEKAFEYRMQNISCVLAMLGREWLSGLKPAKNVGTQMSVHIKAIIQQFEGQAATLKPAGQVNEVQGRYVPRPTGIKHPTCKVIEVAEYERDQAVKTWVHNQACGHCEACNNAAPFSNANGEPFLEVHHVRPLAQGGSDTPSNAVALCPNCHRALHHSHEAQALVEKLYATVRRLIRE